MGQEKKKTSDAAVSDLSNPITGRLVRIVQEGALIGFAVACAYLLLALFSYSPQDPGWSHTGEGSFIQNAAGRTGAWLADVFFSLFGFMAFLFPILLGYRAWRVLREKEHQFDGLMLALRTSGLALVMIAGTGLAVLQQGIETSQLPFSVGGVLGAYVAEAILHAFNYVGGALILLAIFLFGITIFTDLSWLKLMDGIGYWILLSIRKTREKAHAWIEKRKEAKTIAQQQEQRKVVVQEKIQKEAKRKPPKIEKPVKKPESAPSKRAQKEKQKSLFDAPVVGELPPLDLLDEPDRNQAPGYSEESLEAMSKLLEIKLSDFGITVEVVSVLPGPVITRFEIQPAAGIKASRITNLASDLARSLAVQSVRVVEVIPGKSVMGVEIPNENRQMVRLSEVLQSQAYEEMKSPLTLALGHDIAGEPVMSDLAKMPHLLVAGTTGSGKSVGVNAMLISMLYKASPEDLRLILVDPKMLELSVYEGIPHLLAPVITDMKDAANGLRWCVGEMERRYKLMANLGVRNIAGYNRKVKDAIKAGEPIPDPLWKPEETFDPTTEDGQQEAPHLETLPFIVVVIDEFADMMMIVGKKVEQLIARIAQKARAAGIHLVLATQRPSVDVITGLIKANVPTRMAFQVSSKIDSRTILDQGGAEQLLGHGDMLFLPPGTGVTIRVHGAFVDDHEVHKVVEDWKRRGEPNYLEEITDESAGAGVPGLPGGSGEEGEEGDSESDALYDEAVMIVTKSRKASISSVQRRLRIGYNRAARLIETMEAAGVVSEMGTNGSREVLAPPPPE